jgi:hypothetical protein
VGGVSDVECVWEGYVIRQANQLLAVDFLEFHSLCGSVDSLMFQAGK